MLKGKLTKVNGLRIKGLEIPMKYLTREKIKFRHQDMNCCFFCQWRKHFGLWKLTMSSKRSNKEINLRQQIQTGILFHPRQNFVWRIWTILYQQFLHFRCSNAGIYPCSYSCQRLPCYKLSAPVSWGNECWGSVRAVHCLDDTRAPPGPLWPAGSVTGRSKQGLLWQVH